MHAWDPLINSNISQAGLQQQEGTKLAGLQQ
jgi:hypothetical protein